MRKNHPGRTSDTPTDLSLLYEKITSQIPDPTRLKLMEDNLNEFEIYYLNNPELTESLTPELDGTEHKTRAEFAAWTLITHSLLNLELTKVKR